MCLAVENGAEYAVLIIRFPTSFQFRDSGEPPVEPAHLFEVAETRGESINHAEN
jgi:hypothetical protein